MDLMGHLHVIFGKWQGVIPLDLIDEIQNKFPSTHSVFHTIGSDNINGILSCGFMRKPDYSNSDVNITFKYYGALLLLEGEGKYIDEDGTTLPLFPGCYVQRLPDRRHCTIVTSKNRWLESYVCFGRDIYFALEKIGGINSGKPVLYPGLDYMLIRKFITLYDLLKTSTVYQLPKLAASAQEIALLAHELDQKAIETSTTIIIEAACKIIEENIDGQLFGPEIAHQLNIGYENFRKLFKLHTGLSPNQYIIQKRINIAKSMLQNPGNTISHISKALGYSDPFAFSKQFKKATGKSPTEFRQLF